LKFKYVELDTNGGGYLAEFTLIQKKAWMFLPIQS
jgi:hypothetical protein